MSNNNTLKSFTLPPSTTIKPSGWHRCSKPGLKAIAVAGANSLTWKASKADTRLNTMTTELGNWLVECDQVNPHYKLCEAGQEYCTTADDVITKAGTQVQVNGQEIPKVKAITAKNTYSVRDVF